MTYQWSLFLRLPFGRLLGIFKFNDRLLPYFLWYRLEEFDEDDNL